jgi:hypothetical protein
MFLIDPMSQSNQHILDAGETYRKVTDGWSPLRKIFQASADEIVSLASGGAVSQLDADNGDGTFTTEVLFRDKVFICVSASALGNRTAQG